jgi:hypothetical protein
MHQKSGNPGKRLLLLHGRNLQLFNLMYVIRDKDLSRVARWFVFKPKIPILVIFWRVLQWKISAYFMTIWSILLPLEILNGHLVHFVVIWYIFPRFGTFYQEISGNPGSERKITMRSKEKILIFQTHQLKVLRTG